MQKKDVVCLETAYQGAAIMQTICRECRRACKDFREGKYLCPFLDSVYEVGSTDKRFNLYAELFRSQTFIGDFLEQLKLDINRHLTRLMAKTNVRIRQGVKNESN